MLDARSDVLKLMKLVFPRNKGQGYHLPKHHRMTKMQHYICLFGSAINFFGDLVNHTTSGLSNTLGEILNDVSDCLPSKLLIGYTKQ